MRWLWDWEQSSFRTVFKFVSLSFRFPVLRCHLYWFPAKLPCWTFWKLDLFLENNIRGLKKLFILWTNHKSAKFSLVSHKLIYWHNLHAKKTQQKTKIIQRQQLKQNFLRTLLICILRLATSQQILLSSLNISGFHEKYIFTSNWEEKNKFRYHDYIQISAGYYRFSQLLSLTTSPVNYLISHLPLVRFPPLNIIQFLNNRSKFIRLSDYFLPWKVRLNVIARENVRVCIWKC